MDVALPELFLHFCLFINLLAFSLAAVAVSIFCLFFCPLFSLESFQSGNCVEGVQPTEHLEGCVQPIFLLRLPVSPYVAMPLQRGLSDNTVITQHGLLLQNGSSSTHRRPQRIIQALPEHLRPWGLMSRKSLLSGQVVCAFHSLALIFPLGAIHNGMKELLGTHSELFCPPSGEHFCRPGHLLVCPGLGSLHPPQNGV